MMEVAAACEDADRHAYDRGGAEEGGEAAARMAVHRRWALYNAMRQAAQAKAQVRGQGDLHFWSASNELCSGDHGRSFVFAPRGGVLFSWERHVAAGAGKGAGEGETFALAAMKVFLFWEPGEEILF
jgi:hypothetical protein